MILRLPEPSFEDAKRAQFDAIALYGGFDHVPHSSYFMARLITDYRMKLDQVRRDGCRVDANGNVRKFS